MDLLFDPYTILKFLHIVMAGLWPGMDMGVYTASGRLRIRNSPSKPGVPWAS
jgi:hypothetical protein